MSDAPDDAGARRDGPRHADAAPGLPDVGELLDLVERLDVDNERLRVRVLELMELMEAAVTREVAQERRADELEAQVRSLEAELAAIHATKVMRIASPLRDAYGTVRDRLGRRRGGGDPDG